VFQPAVTEGPETERMDVVFVRSTGESGSCVYRPFNISRNRQLRHLDPGPLDPWTLDPGHVGETGVMIEEGELALAGRPVAVLGHDHFGRSPVR
jgi:hypothetical protein